MDEQKLIDALIARAEDDARAFRDRHPDETPTERWIENSFTAALPLAKDDSGVRSEAVRDPELFSAYRRAIASRLGERVTRRDLSAKATQPPVSGDER